MKTCKEDRKLKKDKKKKRKHGEKRKNYKKEKFSTHFQKNALGAVVKNPPANSGDTGLSPGPGRSPMPRSN